MNETWTDPQPATTTWSSYPSGQTHQPGSHSTKEAAAVQALGTKKMLGSGSTTSYGALQTYNGTYVRNLAPWSASNGSSIYIVDRSYSDYL